MLDPSYFKQFECPSIKENRKCDKPDCIFAHPKKGDNPNVLTTKSQGSSLLQTTHSPTASHSDISSTSEKSESNVKVTKAPPSVEIVQTIREPEDPRVPTPEAKMANKDSQPKKVYPKEKHHKVLLKDSEIVKKVQLDAEDSTEHTSIPDPGSGEAISKKRKATDEIKQDIKKQQIVTTTSRDETSRVDQSRREIKPAMPSMSSTEPIATSNIRPKTEIAKPQDGLKPTSLDITNKERLANVESFLKFLKQNRQLALEKEHKIVQSCKSVDEYRARVKNLVSPQDTKFISPIPVIPNSPAPLQERKRFIEHIVTVLFKANARLRTPKKKAMQIEHEVAKTATSSTYGTLIRQRIHKLSHPEKYKPKPKTPSKQEQLEILRKWSISTEKLSKFGFVMDIPKVENSEQSLSRKCSRCGTQFQTSEQLQPVECHYHSGKIRRKQDRSRYHECCMAEENQNPCSVAKHHVYLLDTVEEKQKSIPYQFTRNLFKATREEYPVLGIDCEMGFTTKGFELMRITAVDFFTNVTVLDVYVLPFGEVVDLNTRFSGISEINDKFVSFDESLRQLGQVMDSNTILIGHGLENDMNAMRLIHDKIIDTSILYPKFQPSPTFRWSLKDLAFKFLGRNIQIGEHDSAEDSIAAIDIVKHFMNKELALG